MSDLLVILADGSAYTVLQLSRITTIIKEHGGVDECTWHPNECLHDPPCVTVHTHSGSYLVDPEGGVIYFPDTKAKHGR